MPSREERRISDQDRDDAAHRLGEAFADGRLDREEHELRVTSAYLARTVGELERLTADLTPYDPAETAEVRLLHRRSRIPGPLRALWTLYAIGVAVNTVVWVLVVATSGHLVYPWPLWVAGPAGAVLVPLTWVTRRPAPPARYRRRR